MLQSLYRRHNSRFQDCADAKIKEKIDDAKIANFTGTIREAVHDFILVYEINMLGTAIQLYCLRSLDRSVAFWFQKHE